MFHILSNYTPEYVFIKSYHMTSEDLEYNAQSYTDYLCVAVWILTA